MDREGDLAEVIPGRHKLWRRAFTAAVIALVVMLIAGSLVQPEPEPEPSPVGQMIAFEDGRVVDGAQQELKLGETISTDDRTVILTLFARTPGIRTTVKLAPFSEFKLVEQARLRLERGTALSVEVDPEAAYTRGFVVETPQGEVVTPNAAFALAISRERSLVSVLRGSVRVTPEGAGTEVDGNWRRRSVPEGYSYSFGTSPEVSMEHPVTNLAVRLRNSDLQPERLTVTLVNRSATPLTIAQPTRDTTSNVFFRVSIAADQIAPGDQPMAFNNQELPIIFSSGERSPNGVVTLGATGGEGSEWSFESDLSSYLRDVGPRDVTVRVTYDGPVTSAEFGELFQPIVSQNLRIDLKQQGRG